MSFEFIKAEIKDVILVRPKVLGDDRGFFMGTYKKSEFVENGIDVEFSQDNHSKSGAYVLRGLHYPKTLGTSKTCMLFARTNL
jgi:dTDP-4-dehydrorhamnose 3,5-epimerase